MINSRSKKSSIRWTVLIGMIGLIALLLSSAATAQEAGGTLEEVHTMDTNDFGVINPTRLAFSSTANLFFVTEANASPKTEITQFTPLEKSAGSVNINSLVNDSINMSFDSHRNRLLLFDPATEELLEILAKTDGTLDLSKGSIDRRFNAGEFGLQDPQGMTVDSSNGDLFILDSGAGQLVRIQPDPQGGLDAAAAINGGRVSRINLTSADAVNSRGVAINPVNGHIYYLTPSTKKLHEITAAGQTVTSYDLSATNLVDPQALVFAPSADSTDASSMTHLYLADTGLPPGEQPVGNELGRIIEFELNTPVGMSIAEVGILAVNTDQATLVQTTDTSLYSPPSPDPSGLAYLPNSNSLFISDGEVNEVTIFTGDNVFETSLSGSLLETYATFRSSDTPKNDEPTGIAYNPFNNHIFITDDTGDRWVFEVDLGPDGTFDTSDDTRTYFVTADFGSNDPEGIAYDSWQGHLFVADGMNEEIYDIDPGANGIFDGVSSGGDDQVTHFDTTALGLGDPEGVEFDPDNGHLYILSGQDELIGETTRDGTLLRYIDIAPINSDKAAGLAYAPESANPTGSGRNLYIVDRAVDNNSDPNENDGKMYEISYPLLPGSNNAPPSVNAGTDQMVTLPDDATLAGMVSDDGLPNPPGAVSTSWNQVSGPGTVTFGDASSLNTTASFPVAGTYVLKLTANDSQRIDIDEVTITVLNPPGTMVLDVRVSASADDAEEDTSGNVSVSNSDLELVFDGNNQTVGMRFNGISIPPGATIYNAYIQFQVDETTSDATSLTIEAQAADDAPTFTTTAFDISSRPRTSAAVGWAPPPWQFVDRAGSDQRTPNIASVIQEIVDRSGWTSGNSLAIIITGTGKRVAESWNGNQAGAPLLHVEYAEESTAISLVSFTATPGENGVTLTWETATEVDNAGYNLHRATAPEGPYTQINPALIPAKGEATSGASYSYLDTAATDPDTIYYYKLEDIDRTTGSTFHGPVDTAPEVSVGPGKRLFLPIIVK